MKIVRAEYKSTRATFDVYLPDEQGKVELSDEEWSKYLDALETVDEIERKLEEKFARVNS